MNNTTIEQIKELTKERHQLLEEKMESSRVLQPDFSYDEYIRFLRKHLYAYQVLEPLLRRKLSHPDFTEWSKFFELRLLNLYADLDIENIQIPYYPKWEDEPFHFYLGLLYVLKGSSLGGMMIHKKLLHTSEKWKQSPDFRFFEPQSEDPRKDWKEFLASLAPVTAEELQFNQLLRGVDSAYQLFLESASRVVATRKTD